MIRVGGVVGVSRVVGNIWCVGAGEPQNRHLRTVD